MAMLAESRRKQKISTDPRGNAWRNDENKFGQKLMEKMGWSEGKGLGAKEDGNVDHVGITLRTDKRGVGCSKSHADDWIAHQDDFSALLSQLNQDHRPDTPTDTPADTPAVLKMEQKSKTAKGRVHYQKFTKGKDLSAKSAGDLDCVFGKRKARSGTNTPDVQASSDESEEISEPSHGVKTIRSTDSIQEYFARKMAEKKNKAQENLDSNDLSRNNSEVFGTREDSSVVEETKKKKKSKKDKKRKKEMETLEEENIAEPDYPEDAVSFMLGGAESEDDGGQGKSARKKKGKKDETDETNDNGKCGEEIKTVDSKSGKKSKKNKRKHEEVFLEDVGFICYQGSKILDSDKQGGGDYEENQEQSEGRSKKAKKSKKQKKRDREME